jgi:hypothetical protein
MPMIAMTTTAPTTIQSHGTLLVVVVVVVVAPLLLVLLSVVDDVPPAGAAAVPPLVDPLAAGPLDVVVVLDPLVPADCAKDIAGATTRKSARSMRLSRKIGRIGFLPLEMSAVYRLLPQENQF